MNRPLRNLSGPALIALGVYGLAVALLWLALPARPRLAFGPGVDHVASSPDGELIAMGDRGEGTLRVAEVSTGRECFRLADAWSKEGFAEFFHDGRLVLVSPREDGCWMVLDSRTGARLADWWRPNDLRCMKIFGRPCQLADDNRALIFLRGRPRVREGEREQLVDFRPVVEVWDLESGGLRATIRGARDPQVMPDGRSWVAAEEALPSLIVPIPGRGAILPARLSERGAIGDWEQICVIRRRDLAGRPLWTLPGWVGSAKSLVVRRDGGELAWRVDGAQVRGGVLEWFTAVHRWDLGGGRGLAPIFLEPPADLPGANWKRSPMPPWIGVLMYGADGVTLRAIGETEIGTNGITWIGTMCNWTIGGDAARSGTGAFGIPSPDGRWCASNAEYKWKDPLEPDGISIQELPSLREHVRILPAGKHLLGFSPDSRLLMVRDSFGSQDQFGSQDPFMGRVRQFLLPGVQSGAHGTIRAYDVLTGRPVGLPIRPAIRGGVSVHGNDTVISSGEGRIEVWDILPRRPWGAILGYAAIPAAVPTLAAGLRRLVRRLFSRRPAAPAAAGLRAP